MINKKILLVTEKWSEYRPGSSLSCTKEMLINTLTKSECQFSVLHPDEVLHAENIGIDASVRRWFTTNDADVVVFDFYHRKIF